MKQSFAIASLMVALVSAASAGITVSAPGNGATVSTTMQVTASATPTGSSAITAMSVYVDNTRLYTTYSSSINTTVSVTAGARAVTVQAWDAAGAVQKANLTVTASGSASTDPTTTYTAGVVISSPANNASVGSPARLVATAGTGTSATITAMGVYVDYVRVYTVYANRIDTTLTLAVGTRNLSVQAWDSTGKVFRTPLTLNVTASTIPSNAIVRSDVEQMTGWESCDACAGIGGNGPRTAYSMTQNRVSPSLDGNSTEFWLGGDTPYAQALWWKQLGGHPSARNFIYEMDFYMTNPGASQALEFDVNQSLEGRKYIFGTECNLKETRTWRVWDTANVRWINTGIACAVPRAYSWNRLVWEFERTTDNRVRFISVTYNGLKNYVNMTFNPRLVNAYEVNVAFQMDGDSKQTDHSTWVDNVTLRYW